ncbi:MAG: GNAT family N-acetyltransferase [Myxococcales bacterium]|nr:GNAT family N-acetyltransferase [Myxococcales bacterium]
MAQLQIRPLAESDVDAAERVMRCAFGTFVGLPTPEDFGGDASFVRSRWQRVPERAFGAFEGGRLIGSNLLSRWGSFAFFGPLSIDPAYWGRGLATPLMEPVIALLDAWALTGSGLFTFPQSLLHICLYQKFGFRPGYLSIIFEKTLELGGSSSNGAVEAGGDRLERLAVSREIADAVLPGLDLSEEIETAAEHRLGDGVVTASGNGFAVCHVGAGSEAGSETCYVKFAAARPGDSAPRHFDELLSACESFASVRGAKKLVAGVSAGRRAAYERLLTRGYRASITGVSMHRPGRPLFSSPDDFVIDDWR